MDDCRVNVIQDEDIRHHHCKIGVLCVVIAKPAYLIT